MAFEVAGLVSDAIPKRLRFGEAEPSGELDLLWTDLHRFAWETAASVMALAKLMRKKNGLPPREGDRRSISEPGGGTPEASPDLDDEQEGDASPDEAVDVPTACDRDDVEQSAPLLLLRQSG